MPQSAGNRLCRSSCTRLHGKAWPTLRRVTTPYLGTLQAERTQPYGRVAITREIDVKHPCGVIIDVRVGRSEGHQHLDWGRLQTGAGHSRSHHRRRVSAIHALAIIRSTEESQNRLIASLRQTPRRAKLKSSFSILSLSMAAGILGVRTFLDSYASSG